MVKTVCFSGYRLSKMPMGGDESSAEIVQIKAKLRQAIQNAVDEGYTHFITGMAVGLDMWAGEAVADVIDTGVAITLEAALPFPGQAERFSESQKARYDALLNRADKTTVVCERYNSGVFHQRNRYMVDNAALLICYYDGQPGGTAYTLGYSNKKGLNVVNIAD